MIASFTAWSTKASADLVKSVILAGGRGTRLAEETDLIPKPMVTVGDQPILRHIMDRYAAFGVRDFVIACGYLGDQIRDYVQGAAPAASNGHDDNGWRVDAVDTGLDTMTGGRVKRLAEYIGGSTFMLTYGDGVADIDVNALLAFHRSHGKAATVTAVHPPARFAALGHDRRRQRHRVR